MNLSILKRHIFYPLLLFVISIFCFLPLILSNNWFESHDGVRYLCLFEQFRDAFWEGIIYPRWLPDNYGGYGYPDFVFYQPAFFYLMLFFSILIPDTLFVAFASIVFCMFAGLLGMFYLLKRIYNSELAAFCGALLFAITPYIYVNIYVRGDLAEFASMMILPWMLYILLCAIEIFRRDGKDSIFSVFTVSTFLSALLVYMHPFTAMFFYPLFIVFGIIFAFEYGKDSIKKIILFCFASLIMGAIFSSPYWLVAGLMKEHVTYRNALSGELQAHLHLLYPSQLLSAFWGFGGSVAGAGDQMSFQLGLTHFLMAVAGVFVSSKFIVKGTFILYLMLLFFILWVAEPIWKIIPLLQLVQFPWRLLSVIATVQIICCGAFFLRISQMRNRILSSVVLIAIFATGLFNYHHIFFMRSNRVPVREVLKQHREGIKFILASYSSFNEFFPAYINVHPQEPRGGRDLVLFPPDVKVFRLKSASQFRYSVVYNAVESFKAKVLQFYFPGMIVRVNNKDVTDTIEILPQGLFFVPLPSGENVLLQITYEGTPYDNLIFRVVLYFLMSFLIFGAINYKKKLI